MSLYDLLGWEFLFSIFVPAMLAVAAKRVTEAQWKAKFTTDPNATFKYKTESFRSPINLSATVSGLFIPLLAALIAYLLNNSNASQVGNMATLFASLCLLAFSTCWGVWQSYALATMSLCDDTFTITRTKNWKTPSHFVAQLTLLLCGTILILIFLVFRFEVPTTSPFQRSDSRLHNFDRFGFTRNPEREIVYEFLRHDTYVGASEGDVVKKWGQPDRVDRSAGERITNYTYRSPTSIYVLSCKDGTLFRFQIEKRTTPEE